MRWEAPTPWPRRRLSRADEQCVMCGVCTFACEAGALKLERHERSAPFASSPGKMLQAFHAENSPWG